MKREEIIDFCDMKAQLEPENEDVFNAIIKALEQKDITWIVGNDNVQIAVRNMPVDMMQKINAIIGNKQEPVLDKIRAEIEQLRLHKAQFLTNDNKVCIDSQEVLNVIDKYKAEIEPQESENQ